MTVYQKLQAARVKLQGSKLTKSGKNKFAGYEYFELGDFLPRVQEICNEVGLCGVVTFTSEDAKLAIFDVESGMFVEFTSPMAKAELKGCHDVQNLGAVQTYLRRYLWTNAFEIVEHDALDSATDVTVDRKPAPKPEPKLPKKVEGKAGPWQITIEGAGEEPEWLEAVPKAVQTALDMATKEDDVMAIFKVNKQLFDLVKEADQSMWKALMSTFTETKKKFVKE